MQKIGTTKIVLASAALCVISIGVVLGLYIPETTGFIWAIAMTIGALWSVLTYKAFGWDGVLLGLATLLAALQAVFGMYASLVLLTVAILYGIHKVIERRSSEQKPK